MSYFHVTIKTKKSNNWLCIFKDLSSSDLKKNLVKPYRLGKAIYYEGNILSPSDITQVKITETESPHEIELKLIQEESYREIQEFNKTSPDLKFISPGYGYNDDDINECGKDVTHSYISSGPGTGTPFTILSEFIKHPWIVRIVGGLVFCIIATYFGIK